MKRSKGCRDWDFRDMPIWPLPAEKYVYLRTYDNVLPAEARLFFLGVAAAFSGGAIVGIAITLFLTTL